jgi:hypothetical protein
MTIAAARSHFSGCFEALSETEANLIAGDDTSACAGRSCLAVGSIGMPPSALTSVSVRGIRCGGCNDASRASTCAFEFRVEELEEATKAI